MRARFDLRRAPHTASYALILYAYPIFYYARMVSRKRRFRGRIVPIASRSV